MGTFPYTLEIGDPQGQRYERVEALVDTSASFTVVPASVLQKLGIKAQDRVRFTLADRGVVEREIAETRVRIDGRSVTSIVVFGEEGGPVLVGAYALEGLRLGIDPVNRRLVPVPGLLMILPWQPYSP